MRTKPKVPEKIDLFHVVVFEIGLEIEIIIVGRNIEEYLTYSQLVLTEATYELVSGTYELIGGLIGITLKGLKVQVFIWYL